MASRFARTAARDPARDAAVMLRRLGFGILVLAAPIAAVLSRRGLVILVPVGISLMVLASFIESEARQPFVNAWAALRSWAGAALLFLLFWSGLSLLWTPFPNEALERLVNVGGIVLLALLGVASVPEKMRASNLYLLPIGLGLATLAALALVLWPHAQWRFLGSFDVSITERGIATLVLLAPVAMAWLHSRARSFSAIMIGLVLLVVTFVYEAFAGMAALVAAVLVYAASLAAPQRTRAVVAALLAGLVALAPLLPFLMRPTAKLLLGANHALVDAIRIWCRTVADDPIRLVTGHGLDTALRATLAGLVPQGAPRGLLFEVWFELGFLGAIALALLLWFAARGTASLERAVAPGALATLVGGFLLAMLGVASTQSWWLVSLAIAIVAIFAINQGQFRTKRPKSTIAPPPRAT
jgi:hypothetical protein